MNYNFKIDTHTHTLMSGHAYHSLEEMINYAIEKELDILCITEHGPKMYQSCHEYYFSNYRVLQCNDEFNRLPIRVVFGAEVNLLDEQGNVDLPLDLKEMNECIDIAIASLHNCTFYDGDETKITLKKAQNAILRAIENPFINIIGHPDDRDFDYNEIVLAAKQHHKILELNNSSNNPNGFRKGARERDLKMLDLCKRHHVFVSLGSDAHCKYDICNFEFILPILEEVDFPSNLIINSNQKLFDEMIVQKKCIV